jgi:predicted amidohydrolase
LSIFIPRPETVYNSCVVAGPEGLIGSYQKIHPYETENRCFAKGDSPFLFDTPWGPVSVGICYDTYQFPELMRYYASKDARLYLNPTALIEDINLACSREGFLDYYIKTLEYGVICNAIFIASANLTGFDDFNYFAGASMIIGPRVSPFCDTQAACYAGSPDNTEEGLSIAKIDLSLAKRTIFVNNSITGVPDYRPDLYKTFR